MLKVVSSLLMLLGVSVSVTALVGLATERRREPATAPQPNNALAAHQRQAKTAEFRRTLAFSVGLLLLFTCGGCTGCTILSNMRPPRLHELWSGPEMIPVALVVGSPGIAFALGLVWWGGRRRPK